MFKNGLLLAEYCFGMQGFTINRRRLRPNNDEISVASNTTPNTRSRKATDDATSVYSSPTARRVSPRTAAATETETAECRVCYQQKPPSEQRICINCHQMVCSPCCESVAALLQNDIAFNCPFYRQPFAQDIIDLF